MKRHSKRQSVITGSLIRKVMVILLIFFVSAFIHSSSMNRHYTNSIGIKMLPIAPGTFQMGSNNPLPEHWDEEPAHMVTIKHSFSISETEVTVEQFRKFRPGFTGSMTEGVYAVGMSWYDAVSFCKWLSKKEGKTYRLPTEAEWEYAARAGTTKSFWSGEDPPEAGTPNPWGLINVHSGPLEWCYDWYGPYTKDNETNPLGPRTGITRVIRGGGLDRKTPEFSRSANRASYGAAFAMMEGTQVRIQDEEISPAKVSLQDGLIGIWYGATSFTQPKSVDHMMTLNVNWNDFQQPGQERGRRWSAVWEGAVIGPETGDILFDVASDYGIKMMISGKTVVSWEGSDTRKSGIIQMEKGKVYPISIKYIHNVGENCFIDVQWSWQGKELHAIPASNLRHSKSQAEVFSQELPQLFQPGHHSIGFRIVQSEGEWPNEDSKYRLSNKPFIQDCIVQTPAGKQGPSPKNPWYRRRAYMTIPPTDASWADSWATGFTKGFWPHIHNAAVQVCTNGDLLVSTYTARMGPQGENQPEVMLIGSRLRYGSLEWDMPEHLLDFADANTTSPCFYQEGNRIYFYSGHTFYDRHYPFQWVESTDNGATWSEPRFPQIRSVVGPHTPQPINSVFRDHDDVLYVATDGYGSSSVLWASKDNGETWFDTGGRTYGRHTTYAVLNDGRILGMGGKNTHIDGYMPKSISNDKGKSWEMSITPFCELGGNQRPSLIRLKSGRLFMCGDFQHRTGRHPEGIKERGAYVALSEDEGETWIIKKLHGALPHFKDDSYPTIGYSVAAQAPNGVIHITATSSLPLLHFEVNEAWILDESAEWSHHVDAELSDDAVREYKGYYSSGELKSVRHGGLSSEGNFLLHGLQVFYYKSGQKKWEVTYQRGRKMGQETFWDPQDFKVWERSHKVNGTSVWTQYWPNGKKKAESTWRGYKAEGPAMRWDSEGNLISDLGFYNGRINLRR